MPDRARPYALGALQALSAIGNVSAAAISIALGELESRQFFETWQWNHHPIHVWRLMFIVGIVPSLLAIVIRRRLREPESWELAVAKGTTGDKLGSYRELFGNRRWRRNAIVGVTLAFSGVVGLWAVGFFATDLIQSVLRKKFEAQGLPESDISGKLKIWTGIAFMAMNVGSFFGIYAFTYLTERVGRRPAFAVTFLAAMVSTASVFLYLETYVQIFWMVPLMGFCQLALFGGYAIYFPELFPTRLRSTGTSFCYNVGRFVAAAGPSALGLLTSRVFVNEPEPLRYAGVTLCSVFLVGLFALPFAPETQGQPLPE
jgi:MFS family permease